MKILWFPVLAALTFSSLSDLSQTAPVKTPGQGAISNRLQTESPVKYGPSDPKEISEVLDRIFHYLDASTPAKIIDSKSGDEITDLKNLNQGSVFAHGVFNLISYEWGVTYGAMLLSGETTGDPKFREYTIKRMNLIAEVTRYYKSIGSNDDNNPVRSVNDPRALDDAGSMCAAMIKTLNNGGSPSLRSLIDNYINYISNKQFRLSDGTLARNRPLPNTLWLDDLYMSVPALAQMGKLTGDNRYFNDAVKQVLQFSERMFDKNKQLFMHGWVQEMDVHPEFYWARCNGWALMAMTELLDVLPADHSGRSEIMALLQSQIRGLADLQSDTGLWHQLLDRNDSYLETSATAMYTYCIAHAINKGWINAQAHGSMAVLGWNAVQNRVNKKGEVEGTCVGTGLSFDPAFYYNRPVNVAAAHGYGPVLLAGAEMIKLLNNYKVVMNDGAVIFY